MKIVSYHIKFINVLDSHVYFVYVYLTVAAPRFWLGGRGNIRQNLIHEFLSSPVLQWRRQNFGSEKTFSENVLIKDFLKSFRKIYKTICTKIFKNSPKFSKIKFKQI